MITNENSTGYQQLVSAGWNSSIEMSGTGEEESFRDFYIGLFLAVSSSLFIGSSFILKKKALLRLASFEGGCRAGEGGYGYLKDWMWWSGVLTMAVGEACNFAAYAFASATLVTPLGALSVLVTSVLSSRLLNEKLNLLGKMGCAICVLGSTVIVLHSPKEGNVGSMEELGLKMQNPVFLLYVAFVGVASLGLIYNVAPRHGQTNILVFITICSLIGSLSVLGCKGLGLALKETFAGNNQLNNTLTWFWLFSVVVCITIQLNYLNKALDLFNTSMVTPIYYVFFTTFVILASGILFQEWVNLSLIDILGNISGFCITVIGIFLMQLFKDFNVTLGQLRYLLWKPHSHDSTHNDIGFQILPNDMSDGGGRERGMEGSVENRDTQDSRKNGAGWNNVYRDSPDIMNSETFFAMEGVHSPHPPYS